MDNRPIGIFDSGLGGLTALKELRALMPGEDLIYFGDTGRVPYGARSVETLRRFAKENISFLKSHNVKFIVAACGTISSIMTDEMEQALDVPFTGVVKAAANAACRATKNGRIGVIGTSATVQSGSYGRIIAQKMPEAQVFANPCPLFVPLVENGYIDRDNEVTNLVAKDYLAPFAQSQPDTLILGCTHYPLIAPTIGKIMGDGVTLIDPGREAARYVKEYLAAHNMESSRTEGSTRYFVSADTQDFDAVAVRFLGHPLERSVEHVEVDSLTL